MTFPSLNVYNFVIMIARCPTVMTIQDRATQKTRRKLAGILLQAAGNNGAGGNGLSRRDMAGMMDTSWEAVDSALKYLREEGAIGIERNRLVLYRDTLREIAGNSQQQYRG